MQDNTAGGVGRPSVFNEIDHLVEKLGRIRASLRDRRDGGRD